MSRWTHNDGRSAARDAFTALLRKRLGVMYPIKDRPLCRPACCPARFMKGQAFTAPFDTPGVPRGCKGTVVWDIAHFVRVDFRDKGVVEYAHGGLVPGGLVPGCVGATPGDTGVQALCERAGAPLAWVPPPETQVSKPSVSWLVPR